MASITLPVQRSDSYRIATLYLDFFVSYVILGLMQDRYFPDTLRSLRMAARLTNRQLASAANVPVSLISGLQTGKRRVGEKNARQIAEALGLTGQELDRFVFEAINTSTRKVLKESQGYPSELLNLLARQLRHAGVLPQEVDRCSISEREPKALTLLLSNGRLARLETQLTFA